MNQKSLSAAQRGTAQQEKIKEKSKSESEIISRSKKNGKKEKMFGMQERI